MGVMTAWGTAILFQTVRDVRGEHRPPFPSEFVASGLLFGGLAIIGTAEPGLAGVIAWGILIALALQPGVLSPAGPGSTTPKGGGE